MLIPSRNLTLLLLVLVLFTKHTFQSPVPGKKDAASDNRILYDQRQEGEWNVRADLKNFVILIIPTQKGANTPTSSDSAGLLDLFIKSAPKKSHHHHHLKRMHSKKTKDDAAAQETMHFIESKTAPYHVDISRTRNHLAKLHPDNGPAVIKAEEIVIARSPSIALVKNDDDSNNGILKHGKRVARATAFVLKAPAQDDVVGQKFDDSKKISKKDVSKKKVKNENKSELKLLGAEFEQCGPGRHRDSSGVCTWSNKN